jgi:hypothetical protein
MKGIQAYTIPIGSFLLALLLSLLAGPSTKARAMRAPQAETGCPCKVTVNCTPNNCIFEFDPAALATAGEQEIKDMTDAAIAHCKGDASFAACAGKFGDNFFRGLITPALKDIKAEKRAAYTVTTNVALVGITAKCVDERPEGKGGDVTVDLCSVTIQLLPKGAPQSLRDHEAGHARIANHYNCDLLKKYLETKFKAEICAKKYKDKAELERDTRRLLTKLAKEFRDAMGGMGKWQDKYDDDTQDGTNGQDQNQATQQIIDAMDAQAKAAFPDVFN